MKPGDYNKALSTSINEMIKSSKMNRLNELFQGSELNRVSELAKKSNQQYLNFIKPLQMALSELANQYNSQLSGIQNAIKPLLDQQAQMNLISENLRHSLVLQNSIVKDNLSNLFSIVPGTSLESLNNFVDQFENEIDQYPTEEILPTDNNELINNKFSLPQFVEQHPLAWVVITFFINAALNQAFTSIQWDELFKALAAFFESLN